MHHLFILFVKETTHFMYISFHKYKSVFASCRGAIYAKCHLACNCLYREKWAEHCWEGYPSIIVWYAFWHACSHLNGACEYIGVVTIRTAIPFYIRESCERVFATAADYVEPPSFENNKIDNLHPLCHFYSVFILEKKRFYASQHSWRSAHRSWPVTGKVEALIKAPCIMCSWN